MQDIVEYKFINNQRVDQITLSGIPVFILFCQKSGIHSVENK